MMSSSSKSEVRGVKTSWLAERIPSTEVLEFLRRKQVPLHRHTVWYLLGGLTGFFFLVQVVTGVLLTFYYSPNPSEAHESVRTIVNTVPHGWLIRSIHSWSANFMIATLFLHMFSVFLLKAYRKPREVVWITGVILMLLVLGFAFTGYLLPWDTRAYFATLIGTEVPRAIPVLGSFAVGILKGGEDIGAATLMRMYTIHTTILPLTAILIIGCHVFLTLFHGSSVPPGLKGEPGHIRFFPAFLYRDLMTWTAALVVLWWVATLVPWGLGEKADPLASAPLGIHPEWYFLPLYQTLRLVPSSILGINGELIVNLGVMFGMGVWFAVPFLDRAASQERSGRAMTVLGLLLMGYLALTIVLALTT